VLSQVRSVKIKAEVASKPARSKRKPAAVDKEPSDEIEETDIKPGRVTSAADTVAKTHSNGQPDLSKPSFLFEVTKLSAFSQNQGRNREQTSPDQERTEETYDGRRGSSRQRC
jgi:hypothetical protein